MKPLTTNFGVHESLSADAIRSRFAEFATPWLREIRVVEETTSTNDLVAELGQSGADEGVAIFAERQTAGRGRLSRRWESTANCGLWFSLLARPSFDLQNWTQLSTWAAVGIASGIEAVADCRAEIKWPNDVWIGGRKVAGILIEQKTDRKNRPFAIVGIGVNVNHDASDFAQELSEKATSLRLAVRRIFDRAEVAAAILHALVCSYAPMDFAALVREAEQRSCLLGRAITLQIGDEKISGIAERLDAQGVLLLRRADGSLTAIASGEVTVIAR